MLLLSSRTGSQNDDTPCVLLMNDLQSSVEHIGKQLERWMLRKHKLCVESSDALARGAFEGKISGANLIPVTTVASATLHAMKHICR